MISDLSVSKDNPLDFKHGSLTLRELHTLSDNRITDLITDDRAHLYWPYSRLFIIYDLYNPVGCVQLILKKDDNKLPVEYTRLPTYNDIIFDTFTDSRGNKVAEIYRLYISGDIDIKKRRIALIMLFRALYIAINQEGIVYTYITYDPEANMLKNLYMGKLLFSDAGLLVTYGDTLEMGTFN